MPRTGPWDKGFSELPFRLLPCGREQEDQRPSVVEIHPAVAAWLWCRDAKRPNDVSPGWLYKKNQEIREWMWRVLCRKTRVAKCPNPLSGDDDEFDAAVGYRLGVLYSEDRLKPPSRRRVILLGDRATGSFSRPECRRALEALGRVRAGMAEGSKPLIPAFPERRLLRQRLRKAAVLRVPTVPVAARRKNGSQRG